MRFQRAVWLWIMQGWLGLIRKRPQGENRSKVASVGGYASNRVSLLGPKQTPHPPSPMSGLEGQADLVRCPNDFGQYWSILYRLAPDPVLASTAWRWAALVFKPLRAR